MTIKIRKALLLACITGIFQLTLMAKVPGTLPKPDGTAPASDKPVKVYILAGQSNMVGFGTLEKSRPYYPSIYLSADPSIIPGKMPVGNSALLRHGIFQGKDKNAPKGATVAIHSGAYSADVDYSQQKATKFATVALGTVSEQLPKADGPHTLVATAYVEVPLSGAFEVYPGFEDSSYAIVKINNQEVYRKEPGKEVSLSKVMLERGARYPMTITYLKGGSAAFFMKNVNLKGKGDLKTLTKEGKFSWFVNDQGEWTTRSDVTYWEVRVSREKSKEGFGKGGPLNPRSNGKFLGPEVPFGYVMGTYHDEPVLLIESSMGNRALSFDFRPPSSGRIDPTAEVNKYEGLEYRLLVEGTHAALKNIDKIVPNYKGQGYEIAGFAWFQGHKDAGKSKEEYEDHLANLIRDLRKEFKAPNMKAVVATVSFDGKRINDKYQAIHAAQMAVGDPKQHPEFKGNVASVDTIPFWREQGVSPTGTGYHYNHNAELYALTGDALGRAMVKLQGGDVEEISMPEAPKQHPDVEKIYSHAVTSGKAGPDANPTPEQYESMAEAMRPIILGEMIPGWVSASFNDPKFRVKGMTFKTIMGEKAPARVPESIYSQMDMINDYYQSVGISDYGWKPFVEGMKTSNWSYFSFDPPEKQPAEKSDRARKITFPSGMETWSAADFNAEAAGWKVGKAPFGQCDGKLIPRIRPKWACTSPLCGCYEKPNTLWEKEVLLMKQTFELPPVKDGHIYRIILGGAGCDRSGESYSIYINGKLFKSAKGGYYRNGGIRGSYVYDDFLKELKSGKVTISIMNYLRYTHFRNKTEWWNQHTEQGEPVPPNGQVSLWIEEAKIPEVVTSAAQK